MNIEELLEKLGDLESAFKSSEKSLEEYWRSMYSLAVNRKSEKPTLDLFHELIAESLNVPPIDFNPRWLALTEPPQSNLFDEDVKLRNQELKADLHEFDFFLNVLGFQIAELHRMKDKQLMNKHRYFGVDSETGHRWYNFQPQSILESGLIGIHSNGFNHDLANWIFLGEIIEMGRIYE